MKNDPHFWCVCYVSPGIYGLAFIILPRLRKRSFIFLKFAIDSFFQNVYFLAYIETSWE